MRHIDFPLRSSAKRTASGASKGFPAWRRDSRHGIVVGEASSRFSRERVGINPGSDASQQIES
jgi:hypothetical protein